MEGAGAARAICDQQSQQCMFCSDRTARQVQLCTVTEGRHHTAGSGHRPDRPLHLPHNNHAPTFTKRRLYLRRWNARPLGTFFFSAGATFGVCERTLPARAKEPWTLPATQEDSLLISPARNCPSRCPCALPRVQRRRPLDRQAPGRPQASFARRVFSPCSCQGCGC